LISHTDAEILSKLSITVHAANTGLYMHRILRLADLLKRPGVPDIRVVEKHVCMPKSSERVVNDFMEKCRIVKLCKSGSSCAGVQGKWRIVPKASTFGGMERLKKYVSADEYRLALDWIHNGI
jgi:hypothetical protein